VSLATDELAVAITDCDVGLENTETALTIEAGKSLPSLKQHGFIPFLIQSAVYKIQWEMMRALPRQEHLMPDLSDWLTKFYFDTPK